MPGGCCAHELGVNVTQTHRFPEFQQATRQTAGQADFKEKQATVRAGFMTERAKLGVPAESVDLTAALRSDDGAPLCGW